jgi:hypothetical protein
VIEPRTETNRLPEMAHDLRQSREVLAQVETRALTGIALSLAEIADSLAATAERLHGMQGTVWMDADQAAAHVGAKSREAFEKTARQEGIPRHYLSSRQPLYNRAELDEWLMGR